MRKMLLVAKHQFMKEASKRSFILVLLILPGFFIITVGLGFLFSHLDEERAALGYVDQAGLIVRDLPESDNSDSSLIEFESRDAAMTALDEGRIVGFYVIDKQYEETRNAELVYYETPPYEVVGLFNDTVRFNLASDLPQTTVRRILDGADVTIRATDVNREYKGGDPDFTLFLPLIVAAIFAFLVMTTSGYLTEVIVDEKENRTMEIVVTSLSTGRMMAGKILGALGIATVQLVTWVLFILAVIWIGGAVLHIDWLQSIEPGWGDIGKVVLVALPTYLCIAALMTIIGSSLIDNQEANQAAMLSMVVLFMPIYAFVPLATNPNGALALALTFFPTTGITTVALRSLFMEVPSWQIALSAAIALAAAIFLIWLAGRSFRLAMLRYGQRLKFSELFGKTAHNMDAPVP